MLLATGIEPSLPPLEESLPKTVTLDLERLMAEAHSTGENFVESFQKVHSQQGYILLLLEGLADEREKELRMLHEQAEQIAELQERVRQLENGEAAETDENGDTGPNTEADGEAS